MSLVGWLSRDSKHSLNSLLLVFESCHYGRMMSLLHLEQHFVLF